MRRNSPIHSALQSTIFVPCLFLGLALDTASGAALAQAAAPPPPPPGALATAVPATAAKTEAKGGTTPSDKEKEVLADLESGAAALGQLDIAAAQGYFEQAFARCDAAALKGPILAKVYMALGSLYAGYLQQLPQGTEFLKLAFQSDPNVKTLPEATNSQVLTAVQMVKEKLGLATTAKAEPQGPPATNAFGGFWVVKHQRVSSAKRLYPLGLWVETNPMVAVNGVRLYFRIPSDRVFTVGMMQKKGNQWGLLIDCSAIALLDPTKLFYYYEVLGGDGSVIAHEGTASEPMEIEMFKEGAFQGQQPMLPGMPEPKQCNPDDAAPCPPWEPHCKDVACVGNEDCVTGKICHHGYCTELSTAEEDADGWKPIGLVIAGGLGMGAGFASGTHDNFDRREFVDESGATRVAPSGSVDLQRGLSPSWMFSRAMLGYYVLDNLMLGAWVRFQHLRNEDMKIAGLQVDELNKDHDFLRVKARGPMWGVTASLFLYGDGRFMGPGQVKDEFGALKKKQGFRLYSRLEVDLYGAMYHEVTLHPAQENVCQEGQDSTECFKSTEKRQHVSGMQGVGLGGGILYGVHRHIDLAAELMYDLLFPDVANNFDLQLGLQFHF